MNKITVVEGLPVVTVAGKVFLYTEHRGIHFMVESEPSLRRTIRAINLLYRAGFDQMVQKAKMLTVIRDAEKDNAGALFTRDRAKIFFVDLGPVRTCTLRVFASSFVHEARHCEQRRKYGNLASPRSRLARERGACGAQMQFLERVGGEKEVRHINGLFQEKQYWWVRTKRESAAWNKWTASSDLIFDGLCELGIISI